jgi:hypothetical protein
MIASAVVNANDASASGAPIFCLLRLEEGLDSTSSDLLQVFDHTHLVILAVAFIKTLQPVAWEVAAFEAELYCMVQKGRTFTLNEGAFLVTGTTAGAVGCLASLFGDTVRPGQVATADAAVHSARSNQSPIHAVSYAAALLALSW